MAEKKETKEELRYRLRRTLVECGIDPDFEDFKQLMSEDKLIQVCEKRVADITSHKEAIAKLKPNKAQIAEEAGLSRTSISTSHNPNLLKIYNTYFPNETNETVPISEYHYLSEQLNDQNKKLEGYSTTQAQLLIALNDKKKLEAKLNLQAESIKNLTKIITDLQQMHLEQTGELLEINIPKLLKSTETDEEEDMRKMLRVPLTNAYGGIKS